jgi:hypothetical protein
LPPLLFNFLFLFLQLLFLRPKELHLSAHRLFSPLDPFRFALELLFPHSKLRSELLLLLLLLLVLLSGPRP